MKKTVRLLCIVFTIVMLMPVITYAAAVTQKGNFLRALEVLPYTETDTDDYVTREELAYIVSKLGDFNVCESTEKYFNDTDDSKFKNEINFLAAKGYVKGYSDRRFEPHYNVTSIDIAYMLTSLLGYADLAEEHGGYPDGYIYYANQAGIFKGVGAKEYFTRKEMNTVLCNFLDAKGVEFTFDTSDGDVKKSEETYLEKRFSIYRIDGILEANEFTALYYGEKTGKNHVRIGGKDYNCGKTEAKLFVGYNVTAYVNDDDEIAYVEKSKRNETVTIAGERIISNQNGVITYDDKNRKTRRLDERAEYIYNGQVETDLTLDDIKGYQKSIELVDNDSDGAYEIVRVTAYTDYFFEGYYNDKILDKYNRTLDCDECEDYTIVLDGEIIDFFDLEKNDILSISASKDGTQMMIEVSRNVITDSVASVTKDDYDSPCAEISGEQFVISPSYLDVVQDGNAPDITIGLTGNFYLDVFGYIAGYREDAKSKEYNYCYIIWVGMDEFDETPVIRAYTEEGKNEYLRVAKKYKINNVQYQDTENPSGGLFTEKLYKYKVNDNGEVKEFKEAIMSYGSKDPNGNTRVYNNGIMGGEYYIDANTIIFNVPDSKDVKETNLYSITGRSNCQTESYYSFEAYDVDEEHNAPVCLNRSASSAVAKTHHILVTKLQKFYDEATSEVRTKLYGYDNGFAVSYLLSNYLTVSDKHGNTLTGNIEDLVERGDVIVCGYDSSSDINTIDIYHNHSSDKASYCYSSDGGFDNYSYFHSDLRFEYGVITGAGSDRIMSAMYDAEGKPIKASEHFHRLEGTYSIVVYHEESKEAEIIPPENVAALKQYTYQNDPTARFYVYDRYSQPNAMFVYVKD